MIDPHQSLKIEVQNKDSTMTGPHQTLKREVQNSEQTRQYSLHEYPLL